MTPSADRLEAAVAAGVIDAVSAERLRAFLEGGDVRAEGPTTVDREEVRFARGFHDVFMTVGLVALLFGLRLAILAVVPYEATPYAFLAGAGLVWALAEVFTRRQRLVLPSIALAISFVAYVAQAVAAPLLWLPGAPADEPYALPGVALAALVAAVLFRLRFRLPFSALLVAAGLIAVLLAGLEAFRPGLAESVVAPLALGCGVACFIAAMGFDLMDPERRTLSADNAFWLHLLAAPLIVHALVSFAAADLGEASVAQAAAVLGVVAALALVALLVDRRALLMSGLIYFGVAIGVLIAQTELDNATRFAASLILLGGFVVALGAGWRPLRRAVMALAPARLRAALPPAL
ncbi:hypothetical protein GCM10008171_28410 [Methylopila jiangsuensis]|uniref:DUF2157 domain-containing protein n=1 Tax=Methylopila jiangsuensis TaxID=586230 RepID=A0A9W6JIC0_9HYPH|nr:hypothetical protein [Methylopila jiangsuensis]MDR6285024.1 hypothetical protein [Methylopila jiangsuensis]GLK77587.1 hypothetical protein GCM10008171_28410 [Methylopila jiangsuensis]